MARLFIAVWPTDRVGAALDELALAAEEGLRLVPRADRHVTLRFVGEADPDVVSSRLAAARLPAADLVLGPAIGRLGGHLVVPVAGADELAGAVRAATAGIGAEDRRPFVGHLTVARMRGDTAAPLAGRPFSATMRATEAALVASTLHPAGPAYTTVATFPLVAPPGHR